ncbi:MULTISPECIES: hypothetical protein [Rhodococcus]|uniref:hypothetical protein n=1 Tax=Rhodococcus TaxID=1827 RepID=UPI00138ABECA|nr:MULTISPECIES: hypothetical protein [Rhodococcus]QQZ19491.1 hypothetical protein GO592_43210 [Rhodococcus sp. 21391]
MPIGIGACTGYNSRLLLHERTGWTLVRSREFVTGAAAQDVEQAVLDGLRHLGLVFYLDATTMPNGFTETCDARRISTDELWAMVDNEVDRTGAVAASVDGPRRRLSANGLPVPWNLGAQGLKIVVTYVDKPQSAQVSPLGTRGAPSRRVRAVPGVARPNRNGGV